MDVKFDTPLFWGTPKITLFQVWTNLGQYGPIFAPFGPLILGYRPEGSGPSKRGSKNGEKWVFSEQGKNTLFGGEGLFFATLKGPGTVFIQSLPFSRLASRVFAAVPHAGGSRKGEGSILGGLGNILDGDGI